MTDEEKAFIAITIAENCFRKCSFKHSAFIKLIAMKTDQELWHEARNIFNEIRTGITLPNEKTKLHKGYDESVISLMELTAKVVARAYEKEATFDSNSFDKLVQLNSEMVNKYGA